MALLLRLRTRTDTSRNPYLLHHLFSTANSGDGGGDGGDQSPPRSNSPFSSFFKDVKESLKKQPSPPPSPSPSNPRSSNFSLTATSNSQQTSLNDIMKNLSAFRRRTPVPAPDNPSPSQQISFQEIYNRNMPQRRGETTGNADSDQAMLSGGQSPLDGIRRSLQGLGGNRKVGADRLSSPALRWKPNLDSAVIGGRSPLPESVFGREMRQSKEGDGSSRMALNMDFLKTYKHDELGKKLKNLRPEVKGKDWFSIGELNERLMRLREMEKKEDEYNVKGTGVDVLALRDCLAKIDQNEDNKPKKTSLYRLDMLGQLGGTPSYMLKPPKEHLVEKYFHPDNMSSAEKLKIELAKVRDEFKMSESDCGSARVQIAQLTTKIKHLSSVLHKKDVHSRKGLQAMVQMRKRLLKYLRRTDWDSYSFVISKLGLRDNPDHSHKTRSRAQAGVMAS